MTASDDSDKIVPTRRDALGAMLGAFGLTALGPIGRAHAASPFGARVGMPTPAPGSQKFLVVVELNGGNDGLNMVVPQGLSNYATIRPSLALSSSETEALDSGPFATSDFRLHGRMTRLAQMYRDGEVGVVNRVGYPRANGSHDTSKAIWATGQRDGLIGASGWIARYADLEAPSTLGAVAVRRGRHRSLTGGRSNPLTLNSLSSFRFDNDGSFSANHRRRLTLIREMLEARGQGASRDALLTGHALADQIEAAVSGYTSTATYGSASISTSMRDIAMMLQAGFDTRVFYTGFSGFDTHASQGRATGRHADLLEDLDEALKGFADDMKAMGIWQNCVVAVVSEFGRRNFENGSGGTDHGGANCVLLTGGAVRPGLHGVAPSNADLDERFLPYAVDFRALYQNMLAQHLGMQDAAQVFAETFESPTAVSVI
ncbi:MAG: DUF1501 domain-containing protein [Planctomycetota bacterium]